MGGEESVTKPTDSRCALGFKGLNSCLHIPENTRHSLSAILMLSQCRRRWLNIETALGECLVFARIVQIMAILSIVNRNGRRHINKWTDETENFV